MSGRVWHVMGGDSVPAAGQWAVLHAVTREGGAPVDSQRTDANGRYRVTAPSHDTTAAYIVSVRYAGIAYFSEPFDDSAESVAPVVVYDTSSTSPPVVLRERHIVVRRPELEDGRRVIEVLILANDGDHTRVSDGDEPVWSGALPAEGSEFQVGTSDMSDEAIVLADGRISVYAPVPPGERQIVIGYLLATDRHELRIPVDQPVGTVNVLAEEPDATLRGQGFTAEPPSELQGTVFQQWTAFDVPAGTSVVLSVPSRTRSGMPWMLPLIAGALAAGLFGGFWWWWRRYGSQPESEPAPPADEAHAIAAQIAALDRAYAGREDEDYRAKRSEMKQRLEALLAQEREPG